MEFLIGGAAGMGAALFTNPFDVLKIRMQLQGELSARGQHAVHYRGVLQTMLVIARADGVLALQKGLLPTLVFQMAFNSTRLGIYHVAELNGLNRNQDGGVSIPRSAACGAVAGVAGGLAGSPLYLIKTQIQASSHGSIAVGQQHGHTGMWNAFRNIYSARGWRGFFQGISGSIPTAALGSAAQLTAFSSVKGFLTSRGVCAEWPVGLAFCASAVSGAFVSLTMCPFDVVTTRLYNQGSDARGKGLLYSGVVDCVLKTYQKEGFLGFYKGLGPLYLRLAPHTVLSLVFWDKLKRCIEPPPADGKKSSLVKA